MDERFDALVELVARQAEMLERQAETAERQGAELDRLRLEVRELGRPGVARPDPTDAAADHRGRESAMPRRRLIGLLGSGAAVGAAAVGTAVLSAGPAAAAPNNPLVIGQTNIGGTTITALYAEPTPNSAAFAATNSDTNKPIGVYGVAGSVSGTAAGGGGVIGNSHDQPGVVGLSAVDVGVYGTSGDAQGVYGGSAGREGVYGVGATSGVVGESQGTGVTGNSYGQAASGSAGVKGYSNNNIGVMGISGSTHGVVGLAPGTTLGSLPTSGLVGQAGAGRGTTGVATTGTGSFGQAGAGVGVSGTAAATGIAGQFSGGRAQLYLVPSTVTGHPTGGTHKVGELFLDKTGALYVCKTAGTPGTWKLLG